MVAVAFYPILVVPLVRSSMSSVPAHAPVIACAFPGSLGGDHQCQPFTYGVVRERVVADSMQKFVWNFRRNLANFPQNFRTLSWHTFSAELPPIFCKNTFANGPTSELLTMRSFALWCKEASCLHILLRHAGRLRHCHSEFAQGPCTMQHSQPHSAPNPHRFQHLLRQMMTQIPRQEDNQPNRLTQLTSFIYMGLMARMKAGIWGLDPVRVDINLEKKTESGIKSGVFWEIKFGKHFSGKVPLFVLMVVWLALWDVRGCQGDRCECSFWRWFWGAATFPPRNFGGDPLEK